MTIAWKKKKKKKNWLKNFSRKIWYKCNVYVQMSVYDKIEQVYITSTQTHDIRSDCLHFTDISVLQF